MNFLLRTFQIVKRWFSKSHRMTLYYAVSASGQGRIFAEMPSRDTDLNIWVGDCDGFFVLVVARMEACGFVLPKITWEDDPVILNLVLEYGKA